MPCAAYQWGAALNFKFDATFLHFNSPLRPANIESSLREWVCHPFVRLLCLWPLWLLKIIKSFNQGILNTQSAQNKHKTQSDASTFQIICKVQRFLQNCTTTRGPLRYYCGEPNCRSHILQNTTVQMKASACCFPWYHRDLSQKARRSVPSVFLFLYWRIHSKWQWRGSFLHLEVGWARTEQQDSVNRDVKASQGAGFQVHRGCINTCLIGCADAGDVWPATEIYELAPDSGMKCNLETECSHIWILVL